MKAGVLEDGVLAINETGTPQGAVIPPLLANIYLHYVFDLWAERWRQRQAKGKVIFVRYADAIIVGFEHASDGHLFLEALRARLGRLTLRLHPDKTRLIAFGRVAAARRARSGLGKPATCNVPGCTMIGGRSRSGLFRLTRKTRRDRMQARLKEIRGQLRRRMHQPIPEQGTWLRQVVTGYFA
jgi:RNA-directed DNA polymerase